jgi:pimeloyl-ACP methyl ester carboxylesterase
MPPRRRTGRKAFAALLPVILLFVLAVAGLTAWLVYSATRPPHRGHLVTPEQFARLSDRGVKATEETWPNRDGTSARGWLVRGAEGAPGVVLLHRYGADRSWLLNLGVKINETTNMTVLLPDLRGHGENPPVTSSAFGTTEAEDLLAACDYLRGLKSQQGRTLVGGALGVYGVEVGAYAALAAAAQEKSLRALALDSVPDNPDEVLTAAVKDRTGLDNALLRGLARLGTRVYFAGRFRNTAACTLAESLGDRQVLLLAGEASGHLRQTTETLANCFPSRSNVETHTDLQFTGNTPASTSPEQDEAYDRRLIDFFDRTLRGGQ